jgi:hypothetical protein
VEPWTREGNQGEQNHLGRLVNPWWYLANKIYEQRHGSAIIKDGLFQGWNISPRRA